MRAIEPPHQSEWSRHLSVNCHTTPEPGFAERFAQQGELLITQGFIARDSAGRTAISTNRPTRAACGGARPAGAGLPAPPSRTPS